MIVWINFVILLSSALIFFVLYVISVSPAQLERRWGSQAFGEMTIGWAIAFWLNSPFLVLLSFMWIPLFYLMCVAEEKDLVVRYGQPYLDYQKQAGFLLPKFQR
ncbi:MAG: hypothetical protein GWP17_00240 [Aquificales bacterium]|nr:hypothetical protein [Aquificales bacterium]